MSGEEPDAPDEGAEPAVADVPGLGVTLIEAEGSPVSMEELRNAHKDIAGLWKRIEKRAPEEVRVKVVGLLALADEVFASENPPVRKRLELGKGLVELQAELRGRRPWEATFYRDGRLAIVRAQDPITIRGAVDHARIERFYERYVRKAEAAYERMQYFLDRVGALAPEEKKEQRKPWEQPYISLDTYRELLWGKIAKGDPRVRRE